MFSSNRQTQPSPRHRRSFVPADDSSRSTQWRLFILVAALMSVLVAMNEVRKPSSWAWMWAGDARPGSSSNQRDTPPGPSLETAELPRQAWERIWETLRYEQKQQLARLLRATRRPSGGTNEDMLEWQSVVASLDRAWNNLLERHQRESISPELEGTAQRGLPARIGWTTLEIAWNSQWKPALVAAATANQLAAEQLRAVAELEQIVDAIALADVQDDTVWRADDRTAWFRLFERLQVTNEADLHRQSTGNVGFVQMFRQSPEYRGRIVTLRGTARLAYRVSAPRNDLTIREYCVFWVQPEDGSNLPIVVYALNPPTGFPVLTAEQQKLHEALEVTGYFFKRWVYRASDGLNSVPVVLTSAPAWSPRAEPPKTGLQRASDWLGPLFWPVMAASVAVLLLGAGSVAWMANWSSRPGAALASLRSKKEAEAASTTNWVNLPPTLSVNESLRKLEDETVEGGPPNS